MEYEVGHARLVPPHSGIHAQARKRIRLHLGQIVRGPRQLSTALISVDRGRKLAQQRPFDQWELGDDENPLLFAEHFLTEGGEGRRLTESNQMVRDSKSPHQTHLLQ
jgi:hypothetical protein